MAGGVERFDLRTNTDRHREEMVSDDLGTWVRYPDYEKLEVERDEALERMRAQEDQLATERDQARQQVLEEVRAFFARELELAETFGVCDDVDRLKQLTDTLLATLDSSKEQPDDQDETPETLRHERNFWSWKHSRREDEIRQLREELPPDSPNYLAPGSDPSPDVDGDRALLEPIARALMYPEQFTQRQFVPDPPSEVEVSESRESWQMRAIRIALGFAPPETPGADSSKEQGAQKRHEDLDHSASESFTRCPDPGCQRLTHGLSDSSKEVEQCKPCYLVGDCYSCGEVNAGETCPKSKRPCGHHCNCSWIHDHCHWCDKEFGESEEVEGSRRKSSEHWEEPFIPPSSLGNWER